jgi:hypothetical protein
MSPAYLHVFGICGVQESMSLQVLKTILFLGLASGDDGSVASESNAKFYSHVTQATKAYHTKPHVGAQAERHHGRVHSNAGAEKRSGCGKIKILGDIQGKGLVHNDVTAVASVGVVSLLDLVAVFAVICPHTSFVAVLLVSFEAIAA